jgi:hypothetical protein
MILGVLGEVGGKTEGAGVGTKARMQRMMASDAFGLMLIERSKRESYNVKLAERAHALGAWDYCDSRAARI